MRKLLIASTSTVHGSDYLAYILPDLKKHFKSVYDIIFIPYARPGGRGIHEFDSAKDAITNANGIFTGGGNTFELVNQLYKNDLIKVLKEVLANGIPYLGTSAGSNICGVTMMNTNDMPIVYPPSFDTLGIIPFNINAHYLDPDPDSTHMGETREMRIKEYHIFIEIPVLGLREGSWLEVLGNTITLRGSLTARCFQPNKEAVELTPDSEVVLH